MAAEESLADLHAAMESKQEAVNVQGDNVRALKARKAEKTEIDAAIAELKELKISLDVATKAYSAKAAGDKGSSLSREAFREKVNGALERRMFFVPSFKIYGGVAGLYDYGPPGEAVESNVVQFWRQHYVLAEDMLMVRCPSVTPEAVLKASGHVDKFTDLMVKDEKTNTCFRADHLLKDFLNETLEKEPLMAPGRQAELKHLLATVDELDAGELGKCIKKFGIKAPETKNDLSDPYPFNLMFSTMIGPSGLLQGYMRPETAQGIFVNFKELLYYNGGKLPFAAAQIGMAFRNEIAPRAGLLRVREFMLAEIEHFVHPDQKTHPKFATVSHLNFLFYPRAEQLGPHKKAVTLNLGEAVANGTVNNETLGYFIGRTYLFLVALGIDPSRLRFRQHLQHEMAHYAADCWDAEIECSYGWIECAGLADRSAYDLKAHTEKSKVELVAYEKYAEPREEDVLKIAPNKKELGRVFKKDNKLISESLESMSETEALALKAVLEKDGSAPYTPCNAQQTFTLTSAMVTINKERKTVLGRNFTPSVIEPSFGIGRIIYCLYEHAFYVRESEEDVSKADKSEKAERTVFRFTPLVAPIKCTVFPLVVDDRLNRLAVDIKAGLTRYGLASKMDTTGTTIGKRYARTDELGVPYAITVDFESVDGDGSVTLRDRDSCAQVRIPHGEVARVVQGLVGGEQTWEKVGGLYKVQ